jgi:hypothetical protein
MSNESLIMKQIQIYLSKLGSRLFRNNVGVAWSGKVQRPDRPMTVSVKPGDVVLYAARPVHFGLCVGSSDLIGWTPIKITNDHVGRQFAVFTAIECKSQRGRITNAQEAFALAVQDQGGIAVIARSQSEAAGAIDDFKF